MKKPFSSKPSPILVALVISIVAIPAIGATNLLVNAGFESGAFSPGWTGYGTRFVESTNNTYYNGGGGGSNVLTHTGRYVAKTYGQFTGSPNYNGFYQDVPAAAASTWTGDCWGLAHVQDLISGENQCWLEISFRDAYTNTLITYWSQPINTNNVVLNSWVHLVVTNATGGTELTAPDTTTFVRCQIVFFQPGGYYPGGSIYIDDANLVKTSGPDPEITVHPSDQVVVYGQTATFSVVASGRSALSYQWRNSYNDLTNGVKIAGATNSTLSISNVTANDQDYYSVTVTDSAGSLTSGQGLLTVLDPGIVTGPAAQTKFEGQSVTFTVAAAGSTTLSFAWSKDGEPVSNGPRISGANGASLTITGLTLADAGRYTVTVTGTANQATSAPATLQIMPLSQASNVLLNPGFETGSDAPWLRFPPTIGGIFTTNDTYYQSADHVAVHGGYYVSQTYNGGTWNGLYQDVTAGGGQVFTADGWFFMAGQDRFTGANEAWLEVQFMNGAGNLIGLYKSEYVNTNFPTNVWINLKATNIIAFWSDFSVAGQTKYLVAPPDTAKVRYQVTLHGGGAGSVWFDDMSLYQRLPVTVTPSLSNGLFRISFPTQLGVSYQVLYKDSLEEPQWHLLQSVTGDFSNQATVTDPLGSTRRFYAVSTL